jgi:hypothetical protein
MTAAIIVAPVHPVGMIIFAIHKGSGVKTAVV